MIEALQQIFYPEIKRHLRKSRRVFYAYPPLPVVAILLGITVGIEIAQSTDLDEAKISLLQSEIQELHLRSENLEKNKDNSIQVQEQIIKYLDRKIADYERVMPETAIKTDGKKSSAPPPKSNSFPVFSWPTDSKKTTDHEYVSETVDLFNDGINILAPSGMPVRASAQGTVLFSGKLKEFGNTVIIRHIQDFATVYGHLDKIDVSTNSVVEGGDTIGRIGKSGNVKYSQLHFEIRRGGTPINPMIMMPSTKP